MQEIEADIAIIGGGTGGVAAALAALRSGRRVVLTEQYAWLGGQFTSQAVPPDETLVGGAIRRDGFLSGLS